MEEPIISAKKSIRVTLPKGDYYWCACGKSKNQPFCDGSHAETDFSPVKFTVEEEKEVCLCACKHTKNMPFCDGTHRDL